MIYGLQPATPSSLLLAELGLQPLKFFCWRRTLTFWNLLASAPNGSLHRTLLLDSWNDAWNDVFGVHNLSSSVMLALAKLGHTCPSNGAQLPVFHVDDVMASLEQSFLMCLLLLILVQLLL